MSTGAAFELLYRVANTAWALGVLSAIRRDDEGLLSFSMGFTTERRRALHDLGDEFDADMQRLLSGKGLARIFRTPWVGNVSGYPTIAKDMNTFQRILAEDHEWRSSVHAVIDHTVGAALKILHVELPET